MGSVPLSKMTIIAPRSDYEEVVRKLALFKDFHPTEDREPRFDPAVQSLAVRAVGIYARADEAVKDLAVLPGPGTIDVVFRGAKIPRWEIDAKDWNDLLSQAEAILDPVVEKVRADKVALQNITKEENDSRALRDALKAVSGFSVDIGSLSKMERVPTVLAVVDNEDLPELRKSLSGIIFVSEALSNSQSLVLVASATEDSTRVTETMKAFEIKPLTLPEGLPPNASEAYRMLDEQCEAARKSRREVEARLAALRKEHGVGLLAVKELSELAKETLDNVRMAGSMNRIAIISGYVPTRLEESFRDSFGRWMVYSEPVKADGEGAEGRERVPTLLENPTPVKQFELITEEQGTPGGHEVDPTTMISFVFPIFFGIMFGDLGHGLVLTAFALLLRRRGTGNLRRWGNIFLAAGIAASVVGVIVGEFFGFSLYQSFHIPGSALLEIVQRPPIVSQATLNPQGIMIALEIALIIGIAHMTTGLSLDLVQSIRGQDKVEAFTEKLPALTMYLSGVGFGFAFIGAGFSFNVLGTSKPAPLLGIPSSLLGGVSMVVVLISMVGVLAGKGIAILAGKSHEGSAASAFGDGAIEVFEKISSYLANTISYVRLAIMLLIHAALLLAVNMLLVFPIYESAVPVIIFNILIIVFETVIVYIQDLRLHIYEFFTKFYQGTGTPFRRILPDGVRVKVKWR